MKILIDYSNYHRVTRDDFPLGGSAMEIASLEEMAQLTEKFKSKIVLHPLGYVPIWIESQALYGLDDEETCRDNHRVHGIPDDYNTSIWVEIYNGYRE